MGWLKKITRPISKVLDKIIPNEIKPALPYLSAFAPYLLGPGAGGIMSNIGINNPMLQRALMTGGINIGSQLAQEGSEGEFSGLSALLAAGQGALTAPGAADTLKGMQVSGVDEAGNLVRAGNLPVDLEAANALNLSSDIGTLGKIQNVGLKGATKAADFLTKQADILRPGKEKLTMKNVLTAGSVPVTQGTADLAMITARQALDDYNAGLEEGGDPATYTDDGRRLAIRAAMEAAGHVEDDILDAIASLGLRQGGIVGLRNGGRIGFDNGGFSIMDGITAAYGKGMDKSIPKRKKDEDLTRDEIKRIKMAVFEVLDQTAGGDKSTLSGGFIDNLGDAIEQMVRPDLGAYINDYMQGTGIFADDFIVGGEEDLLTKAQGGRINKEGGGMMSVLPKGAEMDYRGGGMIPMGSKERADDVPARLSKNEFVMTADAVRAAGGGSVNRGAKRMYDLMHNLEARV
jgi:hypothetical protein